MFRAAWAGREIPPQIGTAIDSMIHQAIDYAGSSRFSMARLEAMVARGPT